MADDSNEERPEVNWKRRAIMSGIRRISSTASCLPTIEFLVCLRSYRLSIVLKTFVIRSSNIILHFIVTVVHNCSNHNTFFCASYPFMWLLKAPAIAVCAGGSGTRGRLIALNDLLG
jgi:hypothetical protein